LRRVLLACSCAMGGEDVVGEVKGVDEVGVGFACRGARGRGDRRSEIEVDPKRRGLLLLRERETSLGCALHPLGLGG